MLVIIFYGTQTDHPSHFSSFFFLPIFKILCHKKIDREFDDSEASHTVEVSNNGNSREPVGFVDLCQEGNKQCDRKFESITLDDEILRYKRQTIVVA